MVRKIFSALLMLSVMLAGSVALADYQKYLGGDRNYILFDGIQGVGRYVYAVIFTMLSMAYLGNAVKE